MVIGNGLVAKAFMDYAWNEEFLIFASGVSNSKSSQVQDYNKEKDLVERILAVNQDKTWVYFSTCSILDPDLQTTDYTIHKREMEDMIKQRINRYHIFRLSNLAGFSGNPNTVLNFFSHRIKNGLPFEYWKNAERNIIDVEDVYKIADYFLQKKLRINQTINIANSWNYTVPYIVHCFESFYHKKAIALEKEKGKHYFIQVSEMLPVSNLLDIQFGENYLPELLLKYYS